MGGSLVFRILSRHHHGSEPAWWLTTTQLREPKKVKGGGGEYRRAELLETHFGEEDKDLDASKCG